MHNCGSKLLRFTPSCAHRNRTQRRDNCWYYEDNVNKIVFYISGNYSALQRMNAQEGSCHHQDIFVLA